MFVWNKYYEKIQPATDFQKLFNIQPWRGLTYTGQPSIMTLISYWKWLTLWLYDITSYVVTSYTWWSQFCREHRGQRMSNLQYIWISMCSFYPNIPFFTSEHPPGHIETSHHYYTQVERTRMAEWQRLLWNGLFAKWLAASCRRLTS